MCHIKNYRHVLNHTSGKLVDVSVCVPLSVGGVGGGCIDQKMEGWEGKEQGSYNYIGSCSTITLEHSVA